MPPSPAAQPHEPVAKVTGRVICAGLGPGDPDLLSVKADRVIRAARHVAFFRKAGRAGQARRIVEGMIDAQAIEYAMEYPVTTEIPFDHPDYVTALARFYDDWAARLATLAATEEVVVLCEGDPFFYGSFMHLHSRLQGRVPVEVIPGIPGMAGCWHASGVPITWGDDVMTVLMGTLPEAELARHAAGADALVVMKTGRNLPKVRRALAAAGRLADAWLVERGTMPGQRVARLAEVADADCPYFAIVLVHGRGRRPELPE
ncbi:precorrin-2 C(20)-methyltransferase [Frigidibacter sp. MR17.24]|uniref:precorrin-2 C(20)-methyltransferase n=1 Tax=Frigidibacter sp. MR17.24 TaxID=3127345 RepID=UPI003012D5AB